MASKVLMLGKGHHFNGINRVGLQLRCFSATGVMRNGTKIKFHFVSSFLYFILCHGLFEDV